MKHLIPLSLLLSLIFSVGTTASSFKNYFIKFRNSEDYNIEVQDAMKSDRRNDKIIYKFPRSSLLVMQLHESEAEDYKARLEVLSVREDLPVKMLPVFKSQTVDNTNLIDGEVPYGISMVQALQVSDDDVGPLKGNISICIADTGYNSAHPDLPNSALVTGKSFVRNKEWYEDVHGHGTHVAGTIVALQNSEGVLGVIRNGNMTLLIAKVLDNYGSGTQASILAGVEWCAEQGANIISMSLGGPYKDENEANIYQSLSDAGILIFAASGNDGMENDFFPASYNGVIGVGAIDQFKNLAWFSNRNKQVEFVAPGVDVYSTVGKNTYQYLSGTSMACPHAAGVAALVWSHFPDLNAALILDALHKSAEDLGGQNGRDPMYGFGLVRAKETFDLLNSTDLYSLSPSSSPTAECSGVIIKVIIITGDSYGYEISWTLTKGEEVILSGDGYASNEEYSVSTCVEACDADAPLELYDFTIFVSGSYTVTMDGIVKVEGAGGNFGYEDNSQFSDCEYTLQPSVGIISGSVGGTIAILSFGIFLGIIYFFSRMK